MNKVLIYRRKLLEYSETFIKEQAKALSNWEYVLLGDQYVQGVDLSTVNTALISQSKFKSLRGFLKHPLKKQPVLSLSKLKKLDFSVVHIHFGTDAVSFWPLAQQLKKPVVVTLHGYDITTNKSWWESGQRGKKRESYPEKLLEMAAHPLVTFIAVSEAIKECAIAFGLPAEKIKVAYIGVNTHQFYPAGEPILKRKKRILYVGRMVEKKGGAILINAYARVRKVVPEAELVMVGDGPLLKSYRDQATMLQVPVEFLGIKTSVEVKHLLDSARTFCLPSVTAENGDAEGLGVVILEAQACGVPVVTSARGGAKEGLIHGETGFAFAEHDEDALVEYLVKLLTDDELVDRISQSSVQFIAKKFDIAVCTQILEAHYEKCAANH
jgi:glycosyltransferase involved in cell wall biosynthesis